MPGKKNEEVAPADEVRRVANLHREQNLTPEQISAQLGLSQATVRHYLRAAGVYSKTPPPCPEKVELLRRLHAEGAGTTALVRALKIDAYQLWVYLQAAGLPAPPSRISQRRLTDAQVTEIVAQYDAGVPVKDIAHRYDVGQSTVRDNIQRHKDKTTK